jgi:hypothetical protein
MAELTPDDQAQVVEANARFYRAFESLDLRQMDAVWSHADHVRCIHPGWCLLEGWEAVRQLERSSRRPRTPPFRRPRHVAGDPGW